MCGCLFLHVPEGMGTAGVAAAPILAWHQMAHAPWGARLPSVQLWGIQDTLEVSCSPARQGRGCPHNRRDWGI